MGAAVLTKIGKSLTIILHFLLAASKTGEKDKGFEAIALSISKLNFNCNTFNANLSLCYLSQDSDMTHTLSQSD